MFTHRLHRCQYFTSGSKILCCLVMINIRWAVKSNRETQTGITKAYHVYIMPTKYLGTVY